MKPPFSWLGGKERVLPLLYTFIPPHTTLVDAFGGAGSFLLGKEPSRVEVWNDKHADLHHFFATLRDPVLGRELHRRLDATPFHRLTWHQCRDRILAGGPWHDPVDRAWAFGVLGLQSFSGNASARKPTMATPGGGGPNIAAKVKRKVSRLPALTDRLRDIYFDCRDGIEVIGWHDGPETLFYVDPPYPGHDVPRNYRETVDYPALIACLQRVRGMVLLSGYDTDFHQRELEQWTRHDHDRAVTAMQAHGRADRRRVVESVWLNPAATSALARSRVQLEMPA